MKFLFFPAGGPVLHQDRQRVDYFLHQIVWQQFGGDAKALAEAAQKGTDSATSATKRINIQIEEGEAQKNEDLIICEYCDLGVHYSCLDPRPEKRPKVRLTFHKIMSTVHKVAQ